MSGPVYVNTFFEERVQSLFNLVELVERAFHAGGLDYRVVGGLAAYLYVEDKERDAGRLTKDIDIAVRREDLDRIAEAVNAFGLQYDGASSLLQIRAPRRRAVRLIFTDELGESRAIRGVRLTPLEDLVRTKLTSFRLKDQTQIKDLEDVGLITASIEAGLSPLLRERLAQVRAHD